MAKTRIRRAGNWQGFGMSKREKEFLGASLGARRGGTALPSPKGSPERQRVWRTCRHLDTEGAQLSLRSTTTTRCCVTAPKMMNLLVSEATKEVSLLRGNPN